MIIMSDDDVLDDDYNNHNDQGRDGHAPIYADAHHPHEPHQMVKKITPKMVIPTLFLQFPVPRWPIYTINTQIESAEV